MSLRDSISRFVGRGPAAAPAAPAAEPVLQEIGATGTPILGGILHEVGEYNSELSGLAAYPTYERMRRSDAQVAATVLATRLPIRCAEWSVQEPQDPTPVEEEATEFVRENLFEGVNFDAVLDNALLMLEFGSSAHEDVWEIDQNRVRIRKLAARLPLTFYRYLCADGTDDLIALEQQGYRGSVYSTFQIPAEKLALFTFHQEGANFAGRSLLRPMYQHWYIKSALYKIDAIACERNGAGVPWIKMGENVQAEDRRTAAQWLQALSVHERASIMLPFGWDFGIRGVEGSTLSARDSIAHHNMQISMAGLSQFLVMGQSSGSSGNRALGDSESSLFYMALQSTANYIARTLNLTTIERLVRFNFGDVRPPRLVVQQIAPFDLAVVTKMLADLSNGHIIVPDEELEKHIRAKLGLPAPAAESARPGIPTNDPAAGPVTESNTADQPASDQAGEENVPSPAEVDASAVPTFTTWREPRGAETCLALDAIVNTLDDGRDRIAAALRDARPRIQKAIVHKLVDQPVRNLHRVSIPPDEKLIAAVEEVLTDVYAFGVDQVDAERMRQAAGGGTADAKTLRAAAVKPKRDPLGVFADAVVSEFLNNITQRATNIIIDLKKRSAGTVGEWIVDAETKLDDQSDRWIDSVAAKGTNEAFADGRSDGYAEHKDEIKEVIYSALLDPNTCDSCQGADGKSGPTPADVPDAPNPDCAGGSRCRCVHVYVFNDEVKN